ncbi:hypothetical protein ACFQ6S_41505 [Streptomyces sp. NPDC056479]|uniref:hypothetical protein n=1 Tax=Streptomyces sp. NPDC056479 TaxID=3345832 RepID=UPI0036D065FE
MTWSATLPGAAVRVLRAAAGRRALQLVLVVGGLFALGFLCGERAYAADGVSVGASSASAVSSASDTTLSAGPRSSAEGGAVERLLKAPAPAPAVAEPGVHHESTVPPGKPAQDPAPQVRAPKVQQPPAHEPQDQAPQDQAPQAATGTHRVTHTVGTQLVQPVGDVVRTVTADVVAGLAEVQAKVPPLAALPALPTAPEAPTWPGWPGWEFPAVPGLPDLPGAELPALPDQTLPAPVTGTPQPGSGAPAPVDGRGDKGRTGKGRSGKETTAAYGPRFVVDVAVPHAAAVGDTHLTSPSGHAPAHQAPADHPGGVLGSHAAGDSGTPRHGDAQAVSLSRRVSLGLVPGAAARVDADEVKDRHRDIPVSPA